MFSSNLQSLLDYCSDAAILRIIILAIISGIVIITVTINLAIIVTMMIIIIVIIIYRPDHAHHHQHEHHCQDHDQDLLLRTPSFCVFVGVGRRWPQGRSGR